MTGDGIVKASIWLALVCYLAGPLAALVGRSDQPWQARARLIWSLGCVAFLVHVAAAFHVDYAWSHTVALRETARETAAVTGRETGVGLYFNYLFTVFWVADAAWWWWRGLKGYRARPAWVTATLHGFFLFMAFNATVVFENGPIRWVSMAASLALLSLFLGVRLQGRSAA